MTGKNGREGVNTTMKVYLCNMISSPASRACTHVYLSGLNVRFRKIKRIGICCDYVLGPYNSGVMLLRTGEAAKLQWLRKYLQNVVATILGGGCENNQAFFWPLFRQNFLRQNEKHQAADDERRHLSFGAFDLENSVINVSSMEQRTQSADHSVNNSWLVSTNSTDLRPNWFFLHVDTDDKERWTKELLEALFPD